MTVYRWPYIALSIMAITVAAITASTFGIADGLRIVAAMAVACALPLAAARRLKWWSPACTVALAAVMLVLAASAVHYIWSTTLASGATLEEPALKADSAGYYRWALHHYDGRCDEPLTTFFGFPLAMLALWRVLGVSIVWPVAMNIMLTTAAIIMGARLAVIFTSGVKGVRPSAAAAATIALMGLHGYFLSQGFVVQKEAFNYLAMTMIALSLVNLHQGSGTRCQNIKWVAMYAVACVILALVRAKYINFAAIGVAMLAATRLRRQWRTLIALAAMTFLTWLMGMYCSTTYSVAQQVGNVAGGEYMTLAFDTHGHQSVYYQLLGGYYMQPLWKRILFLPFTSATMSIIPFPWGAESSMWTSVMPRVRVGWYIVLGILLCYYALLSWRRRHSLGIMAWWPAVCFAGIAYICGGSVSRYILPFQPLWAAIAVYVCSLVHTGIQRRPILTAYTVYLAALFITLLTTWHIFH